MFKTAIDGVAGLGLLAALTAVVIYDRAPEVRTSSGPLAVNVVSSAPPRQGGPRKLRLAVTPTHRDFDPATGENVPWDDMGKLLTQLGDGYKFDLVPTDKIVKTPKLLDKYDVLFLTCAPGGEELRSILPAFVARGGTLYASDFRFDAIALAFPEMVDKPSVASGTRQDVVAEVVDPGLRDVIGSTIPLQFDLSQWKVAAFGGRRVTPLLQGDYRKEQFANDRTGVPARGNFLVRFPHGKGTVIFTSFHNEKQNSDLEIKLLQHLVFQLVNATVDAEVAQSNEQAGFAPTKSNLLSAPKDSPRITKSYTHAKQGPLRFSLGFRNEGADLGLELRSPDGRTFEWRGESTVILEVPGASAGEWTATITAHRLPYENFPFSITFGAKK